MIRLSGARCLAMSLVGALLGWWASVNDLSTMSHYRALSHDVLTRFLDAVWLRIELPRGEGANGTPRRPLDLKDQERW